MANVHNLFRDDRQHQCRADADDLFDQFWSAYPRKVAKLAATKAFKTAIKKVSFETIMGGLTGYIDNLPEQMQYVAHAATWLNGERWTDDHGQHPAARSSVIKAVDRLRHQIREETRWPARR